MRGTRGRPMPPPPNHAGGDVMTPMCPLEPPCANAPCNRCKGRIAAEAPQEQATGDAVTGTSLRVGRHPNPAGNPKGKGRPALLSGMAGRHMSGTQQDWTGPTPRLTALALPAPACVLWCGVCWRCPNRGGCTGSLVIPCNLLLPSHVENRESQQCQSFASQRAPTTPMTARAFWRATN
jgi:hypothetical protein